MAIEREISGGKSRWKPAASKTTLLFAGGTLWAAAGCILVIRAVGLISAEAGHTLFLFSLGLAGAAVFYKLVFERVSLRYVGRIVALAPERPCFFSFLSVRGYLTMALMVTLGVTLRTSGLMPLGDLGSLYLAVGLPLGLCSVHYFRQGFFLL